MGKNIKKEPAQEYLKSNFIYDNGILRWKINKSNKVKAGNIAGKKTPDGYISLTLDYKNYFVHRLIYVYLRTVIPNDVEVDHINGVRHDNRIENLRLVSAQHNHFNRKNVKGCYFNKVAKKWMAQIRTNGVLKTIGNYDTEYKAHESYLSAKEKYHNIDKTNPRAEITLSELI